MRYTYTQNYQAFCNYKDGYKIKVIIPDIVCNNQKDYDGKTFPAIVVSTGKKKRVRLEGSDYGLYTYGTGDMVVHPY